MTLLNLVKRFIFYLDSKCPMLRYITGRVADPRFLVGSGFKKKVGSGRNIGFIIHLKLNFSLNIYGPNIYISINIVIILAFISKLGRFLIWDVFQWSDPYLFFLSEVGSGSTTPGSATLITGIFCNSVQQRSVFKRP